MSYSIYLSKKCSTNYSVHLKNVTVTRKENNNLSSRQAPLTFAAANEIIVAVIAPEFPIGVRIAVVVVVDYVVEKIDVVVNGFSRPKSTLRTFVQEFALETSVNVAADTAVTRPGYSRGEIT